MAVPSTLASLVPWIVGHGYLLFFIAAIIEGSLVTTAAGVVAGLGFFNVFLVMLISTGGDFVGEVVYYAIGRYSHRMLHSKFFRFLGLHDKRIEEMKTLLHKHTNKALLFIKLSPLIGPPGLIAVGTAKVPFKKYLKSTTLISMGKAVFFTLLGFFCAKSYLQISAAVSHGQYFIFALILLVIIVNILYRKGTLRLSKKLGSSGK